MATPKVTPRRLPHPAHRHLRRRRHPNSSEPPQIANLNNFPKQSITGKAPAKWPEWKLSGDETAYALQVAGESMQPLYRHGDIIIVSPAAKIRRGDRVVVRTKDGEVMAKILKRRTAKEMELASLNPDLAERTVPAKEVDWVARILWASQ